MKFYYEPEASTFMLLSEVEKKLTFNKNISSEGKKHFNRKFIQVVETRILDFYQEILLQDYLLEMMLVEEQKAGRTKELYN